MDMSVSIESTLGLHVGDVQQLLGQRLNLLGVDAEGAVGDAATAAGAGVGRVVKFLHHRIVELDRLTQPRRELAGALKIFSYKRRMFCARPTGEYLMSGSEA
jgi:hypothetical protein